MTELRFDITSWSAWAPGRETLDAWGQWCGSREAPDAAAPLRPLPSVLRRRVSTLGQAALRVAWGLPGIERARYVFASRHGEFGRTVGILDALAAGEPPSPADFSLSVHNALAGLLSIAAENRGGHTAVAAGPDTFGFALLDAVTGCLERADEPAVLVYYDEPLPAPFDAFEEGLAAPLAAAFRLTAPGKAGRYALEAAPADPGAPPSPCLALDFLRFLASGAPEATAAGERMRWRWRRHG